MKSVDQSVLASLGKPTNSGAVSSPSHTHTHTQTHQQSAAFTASPCWIAMFPFQCRTACPPHLAISCSAPDTAASCYITLMTIVLNTDQDTLACNKRLQTLSRPQNVIKDHIKLTKQTDINYVLRGARGALGRDKK